MIADERMIWDYCSRIAQRITDERMIWDYCSQIAQMITDGRMIVELLLTDSTDDHRWVDDCGIIAHR